MVVRLDRLMALRGWSIRTYLFHAGLSLLDMPVEILQAIAGQVSAKEWARGPSCLCRTLNRLTLPCIKVEVRVT